LSKNTHLNCEFFIFLKLYWATLIGVRSFPIEQMGLLENYGLSGAFIGWFTFLSFYAECAENGWDRAEGNNTTENIELPENDGGSANERDTDPRIATTTNSVWPSLKDSLLVNVTTFPLAVQVAGFTALLLYLDFEATDKCLSLMQYHGTIPPKVHR
jgi:hypothetical protein